MYSEINNMESKTMIIFCFMKNFLFYLPAPSNINYFWNLGSLIGIMLMIQIISGFFLSLHYLSSMNEAFYSVIHLNREVYMGWLIRFFHINGASAFFFLIFSHVMKNIMNSSWKFTNLWMSGVSILLIAMTTAFVGYVLPWGQMSFWAATVITNLLSAIPYVGSSIVEWIWGGFSVNYPTLTRFYSFHFIMPMIIFGFVIIHIILLHSNGSSNPISSPLNSDKIYFHPYYSVKDILGVLFMLYIFMFILTISPYYSVDAENFIEANSLVTPIHIKPEWYFLFAYAILRSIPNKVGGVLCLILSILLLYIKPFQNSFTKMKFNLLSKIFKMNYFFSFIMLTYLGSQTIDYPYETLSMVFSFLYFMFMLLM